MLNTSSLSGILKNKTPPPPRLGVEDSIYSSHNDDTEDNIAVSYWRNEHDANFLYALDKRTTLADAGLSHIQALGRWYAADVKQHKRSKYLF